MEFIKLSFDSVRKEKRMKLSKTMKKMLAVVCSLALVVTSVTVYNITAKADDTWKINPVTITTLPTTDGKVVYGIANLTFTAYQGSEAADYAYAAFIDDISDDHLARSSSNDWVWGIKDGGNNLNYDKVITTKARDITFAPGSTHKFIIAVYEKGTADDVTKATPIDTVELNVTFPEDEIVTTTPKPAEAGPTENVEQDNVDIGAINDWVVIGDNLSVTNTKAYMSLAARAQVNGNNGVLNGFYNGVTAPWGKKNQIVNCFAFVVPGGRVASNIIIDGVKYSNDNYYTCIDGDCVFINQDLLALPESVDKKAFTITLDGTNLPTFALMVAKDGVAIGTTPEEEGFTLIQGDGTTENPIVPNWTLKASANHTMYYKEVEGGFTAFCTKNNNVWEPVNAVTYTYSQDGLTPGAEYEFTAKVSANLVDFALSFNNTEFFNQGKNQKELTIGTDVVADENGVAKAVVEAAVVGINVRLTFTDAKFTEKGSEPETTTPVVDPETTTPAVEPATTPAVEPATTPAVEPATTAPVTTKAPEAKTTAAVTTKAPEAKTTVATKLGTTKVTKATKKKAAAKVSVTFKKVNGAAKYQVQISTSKKFKKVLVKKTVKKVTVTISNKKLKNKKKLYIRVRAVGTDKWSKPKKIKIK